MHLISKLLRPIRKRMIGIAYSPIHILILASLFRNESDYLVIADPSLSRISSALFPGDRISLIPLPAFNLPFTRKLMALLQCLSLMKRPISCEGLFIPNEAHFFVALITSRVRYLSLYYIDEGNTYSTLVRHFRNPTRSRSIFSRIASRILRVRYYEHPLSRKDYSAAYVFNSKAVHSLMPGLNAIEADLADLSSLLRSSVHDLGHSLQNHKISFFFSSPITENGFSVFAGEEKHVLRLFLDSRQDDENSILFIKPHYREAPNKYDDIALSYSNVRILPDSLQDLPAQVLISSFMPALVVGFHSSSLLGLKPPTEVILLSRRLQSSEAVSLASSLEDLVSKSQNYIFF